MRMLGHHLVSNSTGKVKYSDTVGKKENPDFVQINKLDLFLKSSSLLLLLLVM